MKPSTVFLGEMTNPEIERHLAARGDKSLVLIPIGSFEQHGPSGPVLTDTFILPSRSHYASHWLGASDHDKSPIGGHFSQMAPCPT